MFVDKRRDALDDEQARYESGSTLARRLGGRLEQSKPWRALARSPPETARQIRPQELPRASHGEFTDYGALGSPLEITTVLAPPPVDVPLVAPRPDVGSIVDVLLREPLHVDVQVRTPGGDRILGVEVESSGARRCGCRRHASGRVRRRLGAES